MEKKELEYDDRKGNEQREWNEHDKLFWVEMRRMLTNVDHEWRQPANRVPAQEIRVHHEKKEEFLIRVSDAIVHPRAVMIHVQHTSATH